MSKALINPLRARKIEDVSVRKLLSQRFSGAQR